MWKLQALKTAAAGGGLVLAAASFVGGVTVGDQVQPSNQIARSPSPVTAAEICNYPATQIYLITRDHGREYKGEYESPEVNYYLTWQEFGSNVAVEELRGNEFTFWVEQINSGLMACVDGQDVEEVDDVPHPH